MKNEFKNKGFLRLGLEPRTLGLLGTRSNQLSYQRWSQMTYPQGKKNETLNLLTYIHIFSLAWDRTKDLQVNSLVLYLLSYQREGALRTHTAFVTLALYSFSERCQ